MERYSRQTMLPEIGEVGQLKLKAAKVMILGVGEHGSPLHHLGNCISFIWFIFIKKIVSLLAGVQ